ncbi:hypothetical protein JB92DRAFT_546476 [Gautieria morchelliformis]|nr:hypothetical protein JB92DRAFT_546476 [Gautieria morchelliformis]
MIGRGIFGAIMRVKLCCVRRPSGAVGEVAGGLGIVLGGWMWLDLALDDGGGEPPVKDSGLRGHRGTRCRGTEGEPFAGGLVLDGSEVDGHGRSRGLIKFGGGLPGNRTVSFR